MRWLRFIALLIFAFLSTWYVLQAMNNPVWQTISVAVVVVIVTLWIAYGFFNKPKVYNQQYQ